MLENLTQHFGQTIKNLMRCGRLTNNNIQSTLYEIRTALLEADVALPVIKSLLERIHDKAIGEEVLTNLTPGQVLIKIVNNELIRTLGEAYSELNLRAQPPAVILLAGLQGSGKTTTAVKLAHFLKTRLHKKVLVTSTDIYRPAAIQQLETLAHKADINYFSSNVSQHPIIITKSAIDHAKKQIFDVVIIDTAGRLHIDDIMMKEIQQIHGAVNPIETLFVIDSMMGQDAANIAKAFNEKLPLTGIIITKLDGDARGGAVLSVWDITATPVKFIGVGENFEDLENFYPDRMASRILGMGDIISLVEEVERKVNKQKAEKITKKLMKGKKFDLEDLLEQIEQMENLGGLSEIMTKLPGIGQFSQAISNKINDNSFGKMKAIIQSMTRQERYFPALIKGSRKQRIAKGSGTLPQDVNHLLKQYEKMEKTFKRVSKPGGTNNFMKKIEGLTDS